mmetsp:Transcript_1761/g.2087  ORF Transcript_1761/g.2087 Transcript_1761/m.2087 type:complete len:321 (+) Transcript_1761:90-1052(+)
MFARRVFSAGAACVGFAGAGYGYHLASLRQEKTNKISSTSILSSLGLGNNVTFCENTEKSGDSREVALSKKEFRSFTLQAAENVTYNTKLYRFEFPSEEMESGLTVASCLVARADIGGKKVTRPYTPVSLNHQKGFVELLVKTYPKPGGAMSRHMDALKPGDKLEMKGPFKKIEYKANMKAKIGMIAGGTGITPMLQVIREILSNPEDKTEISLIFANQTETDIILRDELDALHYLYPNFKVYYTLDKAPRSWKYGTGFVNKEMLQEHMPSPEDDALLLVCGPKGFINHVCGPKGKKFSQGPLKGLLESLGYESQQVYKF